MPRRKWQYDLMSDTHARQNLPDPPGYDAGSITEAPAAKTPDAMIKETEMKQKRAMEIAYGPGRNIFMQGFMMWMSGSQINIFSMSITAMALINPIKACVDVNRVFSRLDDGKVELLMPKIVFIILNLVSRGGGVRGSPPPALPPPRPTRAHHPTAPSFSRTRVTQELLVTASSRSSRVSSRPST